MKIDFYYWGDQCPHNSVIKEILKSFEDNDDYQINFIDISDNRDIARELDIYSPSLLIFEDTLRWHGPISKSTIQYIYNGDIPEREPYKIELSTDRVMGDLSPLTEKTCLLTAGPCGISNKSYCQDKGRI